MGMAITSGVLASLFTPRRPAGYSEITHLAFDWGATLMRGFGNDHTGSVNAYVLVLPLFRPPTGQNDHRSDVRAHLLASVDYYRRLYRSVQSWDSWPFSLIPKCEKHSIS